MDIWLFPLTSHNHAPFYITFHVKKKKKKILFLGGLPWNLLYFRFPSTCILCCGISLCIDEDSLNTCSLNSQLPTESVSSGPRTRSPPSLSFQALSIAAKARRKCFGRKTSIKHCSTLWLSVNHQRTNKYLPLFVLVLFARYQHRAENISKAFSYRLCACACARAKNAWVSTAQRRRNKIYFAFLPLFFETARTHNSRWVKGSHAATWWGAEIKKGAEQGIHKGLRGWVSLHPLLAWGDATLRQ